MGPYLMGLLCGLVAGLFLAGPLSPLVDNARQDVFADAGALYNLDAYQAIIDALKAG